MAYKQRPEPPPADGSDASRTNYWRPYRSAVARSAHDLVNDLMGMEQSVRRAATEERWAVDWEQHQQAIEQAHQSVEQKRYAKALREIGRAIDHLMSELPHSASRSGK
ncbi:MAG: hypothetical protein R3B90_09605 [Planctomycetaceae bacterium]